MAINKQNIKNKFRQPQVLSDEFSWDNMKDGINEKMTKAAPIVPKSSFGKYPLYLFLASIAIVSIAFLWMRDSSSLQPSEALASDKSGVVQNSSDLSSSSMEAFNESEKTIAPDNVSSDVKNTSTEVAHTSAQKSNAMVSNSSNSLDEKIDKIKQTNASTYNNTSSKKSIKNTAKIKTSGYPIANENLEIKLAQSNVKDSKANIILSDKNSNETTLSSAQSNQSNEIVTENKISKNQTSNTKVISDDRDNDINDHVAESSSDKVNESERVLVSLHTLPLRIAQVWQIPMYETHMKLQTSARTIKAIQPYKRNSIYLYGGVNKGISSYAANAVGDLKTASHTDRYGHTIGLGWIKQLTTHVNVDMSVNYNVVNDAFDYKSTPVRYETYKQNAVLGIKFDPNTGDTTVVKGEGIERGSKSRVVHWLNVNKLYNVPIVFNYEYQLNKFNIGVGAGPVVSYSSSYIGRSIDGADSIAVLGNDYMTKWNFGAKGQLYFSYDATPSISIGVRANMSMPFGVITSSSYAPMRRYTWGSGLYVGYRF
jgi:hypothetical protein